jgi:pimeloyl-ACP methyl ester carboxylesterase
VDLVRLSETATMGPRLAALTCPRLFVAGVPNGVCPESRAELERLGVPWVAIEPAGHWVFVDQPRGCADAIEVALATI